MNILRINLKLYIGWVCRFLGWSLFDWSRHLLLCGRGIIILLRDRYLYTFDLIHAATTANCNILLPGRYLLTRNMLLLIINRLSLNLVVASSLILIVLKMSIVVLLLVSHERLSWCLPLRGVVVLARNIFIESFEVIEQNRDLHLFLLFFRLLNFDLLLLFFFWCCWLRLDFRL